MALNIKGEETDRLVRRYARLHGISFPGAIDRAVSEALALEDERSGEPQCDQQAQDFRATVREVQQAYHAMPTLDPRSPDAILYDDDGLPR